MGSGRQAGVTSGDVTAHRPMSLFSFIRTKIERKRERVREREEEREGGGEKRGGRGEREGKYREGG